MMFLWGVVMVCGNLRHGRLLRAHSILLQTLHGIVENYAGLLSELSPHQSIKSAQILPVSLQHSAFY